MIAIFSSKSIAKAFGLEAAMQKAFICQCESFEELSLIKQDLKDFEFIALVDDQDHANRIITCVISTCRLAALA